MSDIDKKKKAAMVAVAYYLEQEAAARNEIIMKNMWGEMGKTTIMNNRMRVQRRGRVLPMR
jgi:hypothetical protein